MWKCQVRGRVVALLVMQFCVGFACADTWRPARPTESYSPSKKYVLKIEPHPDWRNNPGHCKATLFKIDEEGETTVWSRHLINNWAPVRVFVADSGNHVVTMDEWAGVGKLPVVIYGPRGKLIWVHHIDSLGLMGDAEHIKRSTGSYWWSADSIRFFGPDEETFFIRLHWGKLVLLRLRDGLLMDEAWYRATNGWLIPKKDWEALQQFGKAEIEKRAMQLLDSEDPNHRKSGARVCGQEHVEEAVPRLKQLLTDTASFTRIEEKKRTRVYYVRKAAKEALEGMGEKTEGVVVQELDQ